MNKHKLKFAKKLKANPTRGEKSVRLFLFLIGYKAQAYDVTGFLPDFYNSFFRVAVEIDGSVHDKLKDTDKYKDRVRRKNKVYTIRYKDSTAYYLPLIVMVECLITGIIYKTYRVLIKELNKLKI